MTLDYGSGLDAALGRITSITDSHVTPATLATYTYAGTSRRVGMKLGPTGSPVVTQTVPTGGNGYSGLDRFGRLTDLHFKDAGGQTLHRYQYAYDAAGNRTYARVEQLYHDNDLSYAYRYDALSRLIRADRGQIEIDAQGQATLTIAGGVVPQLRDWGLDNLGNWADKGSGVFVGGRGGMR